MPEIGERPVHEMHDANEVSENQQLIESAQSFDELAEIIERNNITIEGSQKEYTTEELVQFVRDISIGMAHIDAATRTDGFRQKLTSLFEAKFTGKG